MADNKVMQSIEAPGGVLCIDLFRSPSGLWAFAEFRRDPEDGSGWHPTGNACDPIHLNKRAALGAAKDAVGWLSMCL